VVENGRGGRRGKGKRTKSGGVGQGIEGGSYGIKAGRSPSSPLGGGEEKPSPYGRQEFSEGSIKGDSVTAFWMWETATDDTDGPMHF